MGARGRRLGSHVRPRARDYRRLRITYRAFVAVGSVVTGAYRHIDVLHSFHIQRLGGALYERRHELGLETWASPERIEERRRAQELRQSEKEVTEAYGQMRVGSHSRAWEQLQTWLTARGNDPEDYRWLCGRVATWGDPRYLTRLTEDHVDRLLALGRNGEALDVVTARLADDPAFRAKSAAATLQIARLAAGGGKPRVARTLLADFSARFTDDPCIAAAAALARDLET